MNGKTREKTSIIEEMRNENNLLENESNEKKQNNLTKTLKI